MDGYQQQGPTSGHQTWWLVEARWENLTPGTHIEVRAADRSVSRGRVDEIMPDGSAVWYWLDNGLGRHLAHVSDETRIHIVP